MEKVFIIGTDTEVGKTFVSTNLIKAFESLNINSKCLKPVASGRDANSEFCEDVESIMKAHNNRFFSNEINLYSFDEAVAPHIVATIKNKRINLDLLENFVVSNYSNNYDILMIEGAGGLLTPYSNKFTQLDLIKKLNIPVLLVCNIDVGCINHSLLTINELRKHNIKCIGWVANQYNEAKYSSEQITTIENFSNMKCLSGIRKDAHYLDFIELAKILISPEENKSCSPSLSTIISPLSDKPI